MKKLMTVSAGLVGLIGTMAITMQADADIKRYSPVECVSEGTNQSYVRYNTGRLFNPTTTSKQVYCPIVLDADTLNGGYIYLLDRNFTEEITCQLRTQSPTSTSKYYSSVATSGVDETPVKFTFSGTSYYAEPNRYIWCNIPGVYENSQSSITAYGVNEG